MYSQLEAVFFSLRSEGNSNLKNIYMLISSHSIFGMVQALSMPGGTYKSWKL